jgi:hypothetical protein
MNGSDLLVVAPWIVFALCLVVLCVRLLRARVAHPRGSAAARPRNQEATCDENNAGKTSRAGESSSKPAGGTDSPK